MNRWVPLAGLMIALSAAFAFASVDDAFSVIDGLGSVILATYCALGVGCIAWARRNKPRAPVAALALCLAVAWMFVAAMSIRGEYGLGATFVMQEGTFQTVIAAMYAHGGHAWPVFHSWAQEASSVRVPLEGLIVSNIGVGWLSGALFLMAVWQLTDRFTTAAVFFVLFVGNADMRAAMLSETAAPMSWGFLIALVVGWSVARRDGASRFETVIGSVVVTSAAVMLSGTRPELGLFGLGALLAWTVDVWWGDALRAIAAWVWGRLRAGDRALWTAVVGAVAAIGFVSAYLLGLELTDNMYVRWAVRGVIPFNPSIVDLPALSAAWLPVGIVVLALIGLVAALLKPLKYGLFAVALVVCFRTWEAAGHRCYPEMIRYMTFLTPVVLFAAAVGIREVCARVADEGRRKYVALGLTALALTPTLPGAHSFYEPDDATVWRYLSWGESGGLSATHPMTMPMFSDVVSAPRDLLTYDQQWAGQVVRRVARGKCMVVTRVADGQLGIDNSQRDRLVLTQHGVVKLQWPSEEGAVAAVLARVEEAGICARYLRGMDCDLGSGDRCDGDVAGLRQAGAACETSAKPYNDVKEYGRRVAPRTMALYGLGDLPDFDCGDTLSSAAASTARVQAAIGASPAISQDVARRLDSAIQGSR